MWWVQEARHAARQEELKTLWPTVFRLLEEATSVDVIALDPNGARDKYESFHGHAILGRTTIRDAGEIKALAAAYRKGRREGGMAFLCFDPRHGIHLRHKGRDLDLVLCFECQQGYLYFGSFDKYWHGVSGSPAKTFNRVFEKAGLRIAP